VLIGRIRPGPFALAAALGPAVGVAVVAGVIGPAAAAGILGLAVAGYVLWRSPADATSLLIVAVVLICFIPARLVVGPLGAAGSPAVLWGVALAGLWGLGLLFPQAGQRLGRQPVRVVILTFVAANLLSFVSAASRSMDVVEATAADRGMIVVASSAGLALLAADCITDRARLDSVIRWIAGATVVVAVVGILQFTIKFDLAARIRVPGLTNLQDFDFIDVRSGFARVSGTLEHAIEYSVVLTMTLPLLLHVASTSTGRARRWWWTGVALVGAAIPMGVSRTGAVAIAAVALTLLPAWSARRRRRAIAISAAFLVGMRLLIPGLLGTIRSLFSSAGNDPSITAREHDYHYVTSFIAQRPVFGRGFATFIPTRYDWIDNQFILSTIETGFVGLVVLVALFLVGIGLARGVRRHSDDEGTRDLAQALVASMVVPMASCATFDFLSFPSARGLTFLLLGCIGALHRIERDARADDAEAPVALTPRHLVSQLATSAGDDVRQLHQPR
jgi:hypothetical protein